MPAKKSSGQKKGRGTRVSGRLATPLDIKRFLRVAPSGKWTVVTKSGTLDFNNGGLTTLTTPALSGVSYAAFGLGWCLNDVAAASEFSALFDQYRIRSIEVELVPFYNQTPSAVTGGNGNISAVLHSAIDLDDNNTPAASAAGIETLMERPTYRVENVVSTHVHRWTIHPKISMAAYAGGAFTSYAVVDPQWIDMASPGVAHYGLKGVFEAVNPSGLACFLNFRWSSRLLLEMRSVR